MSKTVLLKVHLQHPNDSIDARHRARQIAAELTFNIQDQTRIGTAVSEVAREISQRHADGKLEFSIDATHNTLVMAVNAHAKEKQEHLTSIEHSGIEAVKKIVEHFSMVFHPEQGLTITMDMPLPHTAPLINAAFLNHLSKSLLKNRPQNASEEIYHQNTEILHTLKLLKQANDDLESRVQERTAQLSQEIQAKNTIGKSLQETQERLELALTSAHVGTWSWNMQEDALFWDKHMCSLCEVDISKQVSLHWKDWLTYVYVSDQEKFNTAFEKARKKDIPLEVEFRVGHSKNALKYIALRGQVYFNLHHEPDRIAGICWDITERRRYEEQLHTYPTPNCAIHTRPFHWRNGIHDFTRT